MAKILVTGGIGFIGSHTCLELLKNGYDVVILDNLYNSRISILDKIEKITGVKPRFYKCDILDLAEMEIIFKKEQKFDGVIHFAALKAVGESVENPLYYYDNNVTGTINLLKVMKKFNCNKIVFSSSCTVYGTENTVPFNENMSTSAINPYGSSKVMNERFLIDISKIDPEFSPAILRYFNPIGAHESGLLGEEPNGIPNNLLPYLMQVAIGDQKELKVYGNDYNTHDGTCIRDYIHVVDLAIGHVKALDYILKNTGKIILNLGTGIGSSVLDVVKSAEKASGKKIPIKYVNRRCGDIESCYAKIDLAKSILDWTATKTLDEMCIDSWRFIKNN